LSSFWLILKQQWTIKIESPLFFYFLLGGHLGWKSGSPDTILEGGHPRTIPAMFGLNWLSGFWGEDYNVKSWQWTKPDGKSSHGLWPGELKMLCDKVWKLYIWNIKHFTNIDPTVDFVFPVNKIDREKGEKTIRS
jgi:hypothetical protein